MRHRRSPKGGFFPCMRGRPLSGSRAMPSGDAAPARETAISWSRWFTNRPYERQGDFLIRTVLGSGLWAGRRLKPTLPLDRDRQALQVARVVGDPLDAV